jgi:protein phosphatase
LQEESRIVPVTVQCPGCKSLCQISEQQLGQTSFCTHCGMMFMTRVPGGRGPANPGAKPSPVASHSSPGTAAPPAAARTSGGNGEDDEVLPSWDEAQVNAMLGGGSSPSPPARPAPSPPPAAAPTPMVAPKAPSRAVQLPVVRLDIGGVTSTGRVRQRNEDSFLIHHLTWCSKNQPRDLTLAIVADGLGGHQGGDMASGLAISMIGNALLPLVNGALNGQHASPSAISQAIDSAIRNANLAIHHRAQSEASLRGMAATIAVVVIWDSIVLIGHVGDTRVYHFRQGSVTQVTRDQTLVARMVEMGHLTPQQAATHPARNEVAQAVGLRTEIEPVPYNIRLLPGDWLIVASDGLHAHVEMSTLEQTLKSAAPAAAHVANTLVDMANQGGGSDNTTVVAVRCY